MIKILKIRYECKTCKGKGVIDIVKERILLIDLVPIDFQCPCGSKLNKLVLTYMSFS